MVIPSHDVPLLALAQDIVIFPALVVSIHLASSHATALLAHLDPESSSASSPPSNPPAANRVIACVPRKALPTPNNLLADAANRATDPQQPGARANVIRRGAVIADSGDSLTVDPEDLFECTSSPPPSSYAGLICTSTDAHILSLRADGTACRIVRLERTASRQHGHGYLVVLEGLARISFDPKTAIIPLAESTRLSATGPPSTAPVPVYALRTVTVHDPAAAGTGSAEGLSPKDAKLLAPLRDAATAVLDALTETVPAPLPAVFERRLRTLIGRLSLASAPALIDALFGTLPISEPSIPAEVGADSAHKSQEEGKVDQKNATTAAIGLTHADKLLILSLAAAPARLEKAISILSRAREGLSTRDRIDRTVARRQREFALLQQLLAIRTELDQLARESGRSSSSSPTSTGPGSGTGTRGSKAVTVRKKGAAVPSAARRQARGGPGGADREDDDGDEDDEEDEMAELERKIDAKQFSDEARKVAVRELKRLKKTPPQGAEHGVIRTSPFFLFFLSFFRTSVAPAALTVSAFSLPFSRCARGKREIGNRGVEEKTRSSASTGRRVQLGSD